MSGTSFWTRFARTKFATYMVDVHTREPAICIGLWLGLISPFLVIGVPPIRKALGYAPARRATTPEELRALGLIDKGKW